MPAAEDEAASQAQDPGLEGSAGGATGDPAASDPSTSCTTTTTGGLEPIALHGGIRLDQWRGGKIASLPDTPPVLALCDHHDTVHVCPWGPADALPPPLASLHDVAQYEWATCWGAGEVDAEAAQPPGLQGQQPAIALVVVDTEGSLAFTLLWGRHGEEPGAGTPSTPAPTGLTLGAMQPVLSPSGSPAVTCEVPIGRLRQLCRKLNADAKVETLRLLETNPGPATAAPGSLTYVLVDDKFIATFAIQMASVVLLGLHPFELAPAGLPVGVRPLEDACAFACRGDKLFRMCSNGVVSIHAPRGNMIAIVDVAAYCARPSSAKFNRLAVALDASWLAVGEGENRLRVISLSEYFEECTEHAALSSFSASFLSLRDLGGRPIRDLVGRSKPRGGNDDSSSVASDEASDDRSSLSASSEEDGDDDTLPAEPAIERLGAASSMDPTWEREFASYGSALARSSGLRASPARKAWFERADDAAGNKSLRTTAAAAVGHRTRSGDAQAAHAQPGLPVRPRDHSLIKADVPGKICGITTFANSVQVLFEDEDGSSAGPTKGYLLFAVLAGTVQRSMFGSADETMVVPWGQGLPLLRITAESLVADVNVTSRRGLVDHLVSFDRTALAEKLCSLNSWDHKSLSINQLEGALRFRKLDEVEHVLRTLTEDQLKDACDLLMTVVQDDAAFSEISDFVEQLLFLSMNFFSSVIQNHVNRQGMDDRAIALTQNLATLRSSLRDKVRRPRQSEPALPASPVKLRRMDSVARSLIQTLRESGGSEEHAEAAKVVNREQLEEAEYLLRNAEIFGPQVKEEFNRWHDMTQQEILEDALMHNKVSLAQTYGSLWKRSQPDDTDQSRAMIKGTFRQLQTHGIRYAFSLLGQAQPDKAITVLSNLGEDVERHLLEITRWTSDPALRELCLQSLLEADEASAQTLVSAAEFSRVLQALYQSDTVNDALAARDQPETPESKARFLGCPSAQPPPPVLIEAGLLDRSGECTVRPLADISAGAETLFLSAGTGSASPSSAGGPGPGYFQSCLAWLDQWSQTDRGRVVLEAKRQEPLQTAHIPATVPLAARWRYSINHSKLDLIRDIATDDLPADHNLAAYRGLFSPMPACTRSTRLFAEQQLASKGVFPAAFDSPQGEAATQTRAGELLRQLTAAGRLFDGEAFQPFSTELQSSLANAFLATCLREDLPAMALSYFHAHAADFALIDRDGLAGLPERPWLALLAALLALPASGDVAAVISANTRILFAKPPSVLELMDSGRTLLGLGVLAYDPAAFSDANHDSFLKAVSNHPELRAAFVAEGSQKERRQTVYHLLTSVLKVKRARLFGWQAANTLGRHATADAQKEPPHCSGPLAERHALSEKLDFRYYLQEGRALLAFQMCQADAPEGQAFGAETLQAVYDLGMLNFYDSAVSSACLLFLDLAKAENEAFILRDDIAAASRIFQWESQQLETTSFSRSRTSQEAQRLSAAFKSSDPADTESLLERLERSTRFLIRTDLGGDHEGPTSFAAGQMWKLVLRFCRRFGRPLSEVFLADCAMAGAWLPFLTFAQSAGYEQAQVLSLIEKHVGLPSLSSHLYLAVKRSELPTTPIDEKPDAAAEGGDEDVEVAADGPAPRKASHLSPSLARRSQFRLRSSFYASLGLQEEGEQGGAGVRPDEQIAASVTGLAIPERGRTVSTASALSAVSRRVRMPNVVSMEEDLFDLVFECQAAAEPQLAFLREAMRRGYPLLAALASLSNHDAQPLLCASVWLATRYGRCAAEAGLDADRFALWGASTLAALMRVYARHGWFSDLQEMLRIFGPASPMQKAMAFFHSFLLQELDEAGTQLALFLAAPDFGAIGTQEWCRATVDAMLEDFLAGATELQRMHMLRILADREYSERYTRLHHTYTVLSKIGCTSSLGAEPEDTIAMLLAAARFGAAREFARANGLSQDPVTQAEVEAKCAMFQESCLWLTEHGRAGLWQQCHQLFLDRHCSAEAAGQFFFAKGSEAGRARDPLSAQERAVLLNMALNWFNGSTLQQEPSRDQDFLQALENRIWLSKITAEAEGAVLSNSFGVLLPHATPSALEGSGQGIRGWGTADASQGDFDTLAMPSVAPDAEPLVTTEAEQAALNNICGRLLSSGQILQVCNLARQFQYSSGSIVLVVFAFRLAQESVKPRELPVEVLDLLPGEDVSKLDVTQTLAVLGQHAQYGQECCRRVLTNTKVARLLNMSFRGMLAQEALKVLKFLVLRGEDHFELARDFILRNRLKVEEVSTLLASIYVSQVSQSPQSAAYASGAPWIQWADATFTDFATLCNDPALLGRALLAQVQPGPSHPAVPASGEAQPLTIPIEVELMVKAHFCFVMVCATDGIESVLKLARRRSAFYVSEGHFFVLVRLLLGIKKFREMEYILDTLMDHDRFELILGQRGMEDDVQGQTELKMALRDYLVRRHPEDMDKLQMVSLHFCMFREIGENRFHAASMQLRQLGSQPPGPKRVKDLMYILQMLQEAAQSFTKEDCPRRAWRCLTLARLVGLQIQMLDVAIMNLDANGVATFMQGHPIFREAMVVADAYDKQRTSNWILPVYNQVVTLGNLEYWSDFVQFMPVTSSFYSDLVHAYGRDQDRAGKARNLQAVLEACADVNLCYHLATECGLGKLARRLADHPIVQDKLG